MKIFWMLLGTLFALFGIGQLLQLAGFIGVRGGGIAGIGFTVLGIAGALWAFKKAFPEDVEVDVVDVEDKN